MCIIKSLKLDDGDGDGDGDTDGVNLRAPQKGRAEYAIILGQCNYASVENPRILCIVWYGKINDV